MVTAGKMSYVAKGDKDYDAPQSKAHKIRITLTSKNVKGLEKGAPSLALSSHQGALLTRATQSALT